MPLVTWEGKFSGQPRRELGRRKNEGHAVREELLPKAVLPEAVQATGGHGRRRRRHDSTKIMLTYPLPYRAPEV